MQRFIGSAALVLGLPAVVQAQNYTYTNVIDSTSPLDGFGLGRLNNAGQVSFFANRDAGGSGVYRQDGALSTPIADTTGPFANFGPQTDINDAGQVAFTGSNFALISGVYRGSGGSPTTIADNTGFLNSFEARVRLNESGVVAFTAVPDGTSQPSEIFAASGGTLTFIASGGAFGFINVRMPEINDSNLVSFSKNVFIAGSPPAIGQSIETTNGATGSVIADTTGPIGAFAVDGAPINAAGHVLMLAQMDGGGEKQALLYNGTSLIPLAVTGDGNYTDLADVELNASDAIAFFATPTSGPKGIFDGATASTAQVVLEGQSLFGSTVATDGLLLGGINDLGQIVFNYTLTDGRTGIAIASPVPVPEPGALLSLTLLAPFALRRRRATR